MCDICRRDECDCSVCHGKALYMPKGAIEPEDCPWCGPLIEKAKAERDKNARPPKPANDRGPLPLDTPIPF